MTGAKCQARFPVTQAAGPGAAVERIIGRRRNNTSPLKKNILGTAENLERLQPNRSYTDHIKTRWNSKEITFFTPSESSWALIKTRLFVYMKSLIEHDRVENKRFLVDGGQIGKGVDDTTDVRPQRHLVAWPEKARVNGSSGVAAGLPRRVRARFTCCGQRGTETGARALVAVPYRHCSERRRHTRDVVHSQTCSSSKIA
ncbi:hypothetical protein RRG08_017416 [Elysia crispata]|uniref:Uncharacterized protein n=1 Tax=Elysia crispata TaxID=231223 RepID=A0AAE0ZP86_9GAST|nr:hypothetical protein RRG08_017416 [Elysia crispata]